ncbi:GntR family transcriptional regulator [Ornithinibacillus salinisoli]|uniref:GntR family transcriptional regulator n=1 Tax=Ornithinibacillus salinisoli TaxID=1848459 RepID=A0ABW4VXG6_9BACI
MVVQKESVIIDDLIKQIIEKRLPPGAKLPSENELAEMYDVPRITVRNALLKLEERSYIYSVQGKGRYLKEKSIPIQLPLTGKTSFTEKMEKMGYDLRTINISCEKITYDPKIYEVLQASEVDTVYQIGRLRLINEEPIAIHYSYVNEANLPTIEEDGPSILSMFAYYREQGIQRFTSRKTFLSVTFPTSKEQQLLACKSMVPLIIVESDCIDADSQSVLEHTKILYRSDKFKYDITIDI